MPNPITIIKNNSAWSRLPISYRGAIIIAIPAICLLGTLGAWIWSRQIGLNTLNQINHTEAVISKSNQLLMSLLNAETGVRGYHINREDDFLIPYRYAKTNIPTILLELDNLLQNNLQQSAKWNEIKRLVNQEMNLLEQKIYELRLQPEGTYSPRDLSLLSQGKQVMDSLRSTIGQLQSEEQTLLTRQQEQLENFRRVITYIQWSSAWISAAAYWAAVYLFNRLDQDLRERELQLSESKTFIETITTNIVDAVITINYKNQIETFNPAATDMFGYQHCDVIGQDLTLLLIEPDLPIAEKKEKVNFWHTNLLQSERRWQTTGYRKDRTSFPLEISISELEPDAQLMIIIRDITATEEAKAKLQSRADELARLSSILAKANTDLEKQNQELDKFAYVASHDLKAPLRAIASLSEWIEEDLTDELSGETRYQMTLLRGRVHRLEELINGLLAYSRVGRVKNEIEIVDVKKLLNEVIDSLSPPDTIKITIASEMPILRTHKIPLRQVFANLISNAIKHRDSAEGKITIAVEELGEFYKFSVADDGPGIPSEFHEKIFAIFQTLYPRDTKENTGIGLSIVKKILDHQGGIIDIELNSDSGTTFYFTWPK
ncbi:diguanylate cyclase [Aphanothece hegewaldii CCALA 016]|uniref:histidine kinase n=1 Tax=Aphanothece hegewaldii CCALA 016 TaxID=2107694 RepID=A0A2T1M401_9CHRO|nr:CHASE3 domain-containing protein [Aphanothece hegewaldii]PSF39480.1 diguanylate cyclase [Aphanothece hegewaldii CCALA 016]